MNSVFNALNVLNGTVHAMLNNVLNALNLLNGTMHATFSQYGRANQNEYMIINLNTPAFPGNARYPGIATKS